MKNAIISFLLLLSFQATAQPVIHHAMDYVVGDTFSTLSTSIITNYVEPTGSNYTWDFSGLSTSTTNSIAQNKIIPLSSVTYSTSYPFADFLINYIISSGSTKLCGFEYFQKSSISKDWGGVNLTINYPDTTTNKLQYIVPKRTTAPVMTMTTSFSDSFSYIGTISDTNMGVTYIIADGYGTLLLPGNTYDSVLRTRTTQIRTRNSPVIHSTDTTITYRWYRDNYKTPLLQIDSFSGYAYGHFVPYYQVHYLLYEGAATTGVSSIPKENKNYTALFHDNDIILNGPFDNNQQYQVALFDLSGRRLLSEKFNPRNNYFEIKTNTLFPPGIYILNIISTTENSSIKMVKQ